MTNGKKMMHYNTIDPEKPSPQKSKAESCRWPIQPKKDFVVSDTILETSFMSDIIWMKKRKCEISFCFSIFQISNVKHTFLRSGPKVKFIYVAGINLSMFQTLTNKFDYLSYNN